MQMTGCERAVVLSVFGSVIVVAGCSAPAAIHAYSGPERPISELATIHKTTLDFIPGYAAQVVAVRMVDRKNSFVTNLRPDRYDYPEKIYVIPGKRRLQFHHFTYWPTGIGNLDAYASGTYDLEAGEEYEATSTHADPGSVAFKLIRRRDGKQIWHDQ